MLRKLANGMLATLAPAAGLQSAALTRPSLRPLFAAALQPRAVRWAATTAQDKPQAAPPASVEVTEAPKKQTSSYRERKASKEAKEAKEAAETKGAQDDLTVDLADPDAPAVVKKKKKNWYKEQSKKKALEAKYGPSDEKPKEEPKAPAPQEAKDMVGAEGLKDFFFKGTVFDDVEVGRQWLARDLRVKSYEDLQKLWFVLLKERNMLLTTKFECDRLRRNMPHPERLWKVRKGMAAIKTVISEREIALSHAYKQEPDLITKLREERGVLPPIKAAEVPLSESESKALAGVEYPTRATKPGQQRRPLKHRERSLFMREVIVARKRVERAEKAQVRAEVQALDNSTLLAEVSGVKAKVAEGAIYPDFTVRERQVMHEAANRGLDPGLRRL